MQMNMSGPFKHAAMARELAGEAVQDNQAAFSQMERNWNIARASQDITVALAAREDCSSGWLPVPFLDKKPILTLVPKL